MNEGTETAEGTRAITVSVSPLALMEDIDLAEVMSKQLTPVPEWTYSFLVKGQKVEGISVRGAQDAARALSTQGEAIRIIEVKFEREDERDAYFTAKAGRYAIAPDGREILTDATVRGKRQSKYIPLRDGGEQFNLFWYEIGVAKAARNAIDALLPEALRQWMKAQARAAPRNGAAPQPVPRTTKDGRCAHCNAPAGRPHGTTCPVAQTAIEPDAQEVPTAPPAATEQPPALRIQRLLAAYPEAQRATLVDGINLKFGRKVLTQQGETMLGRTALRPEEREQVLALLEQVRPAGAE